MTTSPPRPPSPPLGPPRGTYFSRRNARMPLPPSPALTRILASSRNCMGGPGCGLRDSGERVRPESRIPIPVSLFRGVNADELTHPAAVLELDRARHFRKQRIVLAPTYVETRLDLGAALPHNDRAARDQLAAENLHAQPLRVGIAPVFGTA